MDSRSPQLEEPVLAEELGGGLTLLTLNRPERRNALNVDLIDALDAACDRIQRDRSCRAVILTGAGVGFCAGLDLTGYGTPRGADNLGEVEAGFAVQQHIVRAIIRLRALPQPVIAAVNGAASGGGLALAVASDVRVAAPTARFTVASIRIGLSGCDLGMSWLLPRLIGAGRAWELMLTGRTIDADEAERIGLVLRVAPDGDVLASAVEIGRMIAANSAWGVQMTKEVMWSQLETSSLEAAIDLENRTQILSAFTGGMREALAAFAERRAPITN